MKNKKIYFLAVLLSMASYAYEASVETGVKVNSSFAPKYETTGYELNLLKFNIKPLKELEFGVDIKSARKDFSINDYDKDIKHIYNWKKRDANHDVMLKFLINNENNLTKDLKLTNNFQYYLDDFWIKKNYSKDGTIKEEVKTEYLEDDGTKQALGNTVFSTNISGKVKNTEIDSKIEYKANQFHRFDKDEAYFKVNSKTDTKLNDKYALNSEYNFDIDLNAASRPFDALDTELDEFPDFHSGDYVTKFDQKFNFGFKYSENKNNYGLKLEMKHHAEYSKGQKKEDPYKTFYNILDPKLTLSASNNVDLKVGKLVFDNSLGNLVEARMTKYLPDESRKNNYELALKYEPSLKSKLKYMYNKNKDDLELDTSLEYFPSFLLYPTNINADVVPHNFKLGFKTKYVRKLSDKQDVSFDFDNKLSKIVKFSDSKENEPKNNIESKLNVKYTNKEIKDLNLSVNLNNEFKEDTIKKVKILHPNNTSNKLNLSIETEYKGIKDLVFINKLKYKNSLALNHVTRPDDKNVLTYLINSLEFDSSVEYTKKISDKLTLKSGLDVLAKFDTLLLRSEKMYNYNTNDIEKTKEKPMLSDAVNNKYNLGGSFELKPKVSVVYMPIKNLELSSGFEISTLFEKKVIDLIKDEKRPDEGLFGPIDKKFEFRKLKPSLTLNLKYKW